MKSPGQLRQVIKWLLVGAIGYFVLAEVAELINAQIMGM
jgi:hypothetical protein